MPYDIPNISVKIEPYKDDDSDLKSLMQLALMQRRMARAGGGGGSSNGGFGKGDVYYMTDPQNPGGKPRAVFVPGSKAPAIKHNLAYAQAENDKEVAAAFLNQNPEVQTVIAGLDQLDVATQNARLKELREVIVPRYAEKHKISSEQAMGIFDMALAPAKERVEQQTREVANASRWDAFTDLLSHNIREAYHRIVNPADTDAEVRARAQDYLKREREIIEQNAYLRDQAKRESAGESILDRSDGLTGLVANAGMSAARLLPSVGSMLASAKVGATVGGAVAGPYGALAGGLAGAAYAGGASAPYDYATILESREDLSDAQKAEAFSSGRTAATALGAGLGLIPGGVGRGVWNAAQQGLTRIGLTSLGRQANKAGSAYAAELLARGATQEAAKSGGRQVASRVVTDAMAKRAADAQKWGLLGGYAHNLPFTAAELGTMNAGFVGGLNAIQNASGAPVPLGSGVGDAFLTGVATAPFFGLLNARQRPSMPRGYNNAGEYELPQQALPPADATPSNPPVTPVATGAVELVHAPVIKSPRVSPPVREVQEPPVQPVAPPELVAFHGDVAPLLGSKWRESDVFAGMSKQDAAVARERLLVEAVNKFYDAGGTPEAVSEYITASARRRKSASADGITFIPKEGRDILREVSDSIGATRAKSSNIAVQEAPEVTAPVAAAPDTSAPVVDVPLAEPPLADTVAPRDQLIAQLTEGTTDVANPAGRGGDSVVGELGLKAASDTAPPVASGDSGVAAPTARIAEASADARVALVAGDNQPVKSRRAGRVRAADAAEGATPTRVDSATGARPVADADGGPSAPAAAGGNAAASVRARGRRNAASARAGSAVSDTTAGASKQSTDGAVDAAVARLLGLSDEIRAQSKQRAQSAMDAEEAALRAGELEPTVDMPAPRVSPPVATAQKAASAVAGTVTKAPKVRVPKNRSKPAASAQPDDAPRVRRRIVVDEAKDAETPVSTGELTPPLAGIKGAARRSVPSKLVSPDELNATLAGLKLRSFQSAAKALYSKKEPGNLIPGGFEDMTAQNYADVEWSRPYRDGVYNEVHRLLAKEWSGDKLSAGEARRLKALRSNVPELDVALGVPKEWTDTAEMAALLQNVSKQMATKETAEYAVADQKTLASNIRDKLDICQ